MPTNCPSFLHNFSNELNNKTKIFFKSTTVVADSNSDLFDLSTSSNMHYNTTTSSSVIDKCDSLQNKEFRNCASSCPLGCDNLELRLCTPCVSGCFCKNGVLIIILRYI